MPFVSQSQRRYLFAKEPDVAREFAAKTPKGKKLPEHVKKAYVLGIADALERFGFKYAGEELRLKIPSRTFHGLEAAHKNVAKKANEDTADVLAEVLETMPVPKTPGDQLMTRDPLDRSPAWGSPSNLSGGDAANRLSDMGQPTGFGGV